MRKMLQYISLFAVLVFMSWVILHDSDSNNISFSESEISSYQDHLFTKRISQTDASEGRLSLRIPAAEINLESSGSDIFSARVNYNRGENGEIPVFTETRKDNLLELELKHEYDTPVSLRGHKNAAQWNISTRPNFPLSYDIQIGAGNITADLSGSQVTSFELTTGAAKADINLSNSRVQTIEIKAGVGSVSLDVSGSRHDDLDVDISGGIGALTIYVPEQVGVSLTASGLGSVTARNFSRDGRTYTNEHWGKTTHSVTVNVSAGIGSVSVVTQ